MKEKEGNDMAVLVTGGAGYTGSNVCIELLKQGYEVAMVDNFLTSSIEIIEYIKKETGKDFKLYAMDLGHKELVERIFKENQIEGVIHFAGIKCTGPFTNNPLEYYYTNLASTLVLGKVMSKYNVKRMVFSSSEGFYGDNGSEMSTYGSAKIMIERILQEVYNADPEWSIDIIRYLNKEGNVYSKKDISASQMSKIYVEALKNLDPCTIKSHELIIESGQVNLKRL